MASIYDNSVTAASNTTIDGTDVSGTTGKVKDGDNVLRSIAAFEAQFIRDLGAVNTVGGSGDVISVTLASGIAAYATGQIFRFIAGAANTTNVTLNVNSIGAKAVRKISGGTDVALVAGDLVAGETYTVVYRATANSAAGGWVLVGTATTAPTQAVDTNTTAIATTAFVLAQSGTQADLEAASSTTKFVSPGRQKFHPSAAKAWVSFTGSGSNGAQTITSSYNVSSVTRTATGAYTVTFTTAFSSAAYAAVATQTSGATNGWAQIVSPATGTVGLLFVTAPIATFDPGTGFVVCYGDQ